MSAVDNVKKLLPLVRVVSSGRRVADEVRATRGQADLVTRLNAVGNAVVAVTGLILLIRVLRRSRSA